MKAADVPLYYNAVSILEDNLTERATKIALYSHEQNLTFQAIAQQANQVGNALLASGVRTGECVGILAPDSAEWVTSFFGTIKIGAIAVLLNTLLQAHEYDYILRDSRLRLLIVHESLLPLIEQIRHQQPSLQQIIVIDPPQRDIDLSFQHWLEPQPTELTAAVIHRDDFCSLHYTSGTTGQPKGMFHAHKDYPLMGQHTGVELFGLCESDRTFAVGKLFFAYGLGTNLIQPWYVGASIVLYSGSSRLAVKLLETIAHFKPSVLFGVPTAYIAMLSLGEITTRYDLASLRLCISAGEGLPAAVWQRWKEQTGLVLLDNTGCTECFTSFLANTPTALRPGSSGKAVPGFAVRLVDEAGNPVPAGEIGNMQIKAESLALFYLHQYEKSQQTFRGEWAFTGDKYTLDADGFYWHAGRADDLFRVGGLWVSPIEVEGVLNNHPAVLTCAVVAQQDGQEITKPKAFICLNRGYQPSDDLLRDILRHCSSHLPTHKCPRWVEFVEDLPKTATGKIQRFKLRAA